MKQQQKTLTLWIVVILMMAFLAKVVSKNKETYKNITYSEFVQQVESKHVEEVVFKGKSTIIGKFKSTYDNGNRFRLTGNTGDPTFNLLRQHEITPNYEDEEKPEFFTTLLVNWGPMILLIVIFYFFLRQIQAGGGKAMSFGKSKAKMLNASDKKITFKDVAGVEEAKEELVEIVDFLKDPKKYTALGGKIPKGVILVGPPGTGKTLLARAVAGEADVPFFSISGSDFVEMFVGVGASRVRDLFEQGKKHAPCIIFILKVHTTKTPIGEDVDLEIVAKGTPGFTGADLANLVNEAALQAARVNKKRLTREDFEFAKDKVLMGPERKSMMISDLEKKVTAYHEAGHTLVGMNLPNTDPIHKVSIMPRGQALGVTMTLPKEDMHNMTRAKAENLIAFLMGGRCAEELAFNEQTNGASNDIERATLLAHHMVCTWGMSDKLGPVNYHKSNMSPWGPQSNTTDYSEKIAQEIDEEIQRFVEDNHKVAMNILKENVDALHRLAAGLVVWETLDFNQVQDLVNGKDIGVPIITPKKQSGEGSGGEGSKAASTSGNVGTVLGNRPLPV